MVILGIETSCDETAAAVLQKNGDKITILSNVISSSANLQQKYGGIIPEQAAREQLKAIIPVITEALIQSNLYPLSSKSNLLSSNIHPPEIDAIAVTYGPGLIGSLLVGVETAKTLSLIWQKPLIPVNHLLGHFYANWIEQKLQSKSELGKYSVQLSALPPNMTRDSNSARNQPKVSRVEGRTVSLQPDETGNLPSFPLIGLLVSGGHTDLVLFKNHNDYQYLGGTRDDAAGECFDKCARLLGLPYPGGLEISKLAKDGNPKAYNLPSPMLGSNDFDFSYSGLKTAVANLAIKLSSNKAIKQHSIAAFLPSSIADLCASIELAIIKPLVKKTLKAAKQFNVKTIILGGGVAANDKLISELKLQSTNYQLPTEIFAPQKSLCTDNAAMIASAAFFTKETIEPQKLQANPNLSLIF